MQIDKSWQQRQVRDIKIRITHISDRSISSIMPRLAFTDFCASVTSPSNFGIDKPPRLFREAIILNIVISSCHDAGSKLLCVEFDFR